ncbi:phosphoribosylglycinamide formyltransferase [Flaviflexus equikiangi]|uniref:Phosphoribosylglycinamide formyltransferase n=1 Tax=Flaviflexus equikiangi TaxID=2758573 RepID=A0ABS2TF59_9ACTO|nr:phosphoribosylglycinamide formyltransferase [Flaviflexus equikiangi]MBM9432967.1 phosphoribosylglycinamide formyltransferase [Flaviflexus equikiangi]
MTGRLAVLISGGGSNLRALLDACEDPEYGCEVVLVIADRHGCAGIDHAAEAGIDTAVLAVTDFPSREEWDQALASRLTESSPDLVVSAGFLKILGSAVLSAFPGLIVNTHNSLLPSFPGIHGPRDALDYGVKIAGATLFVVDEGMDTGQILAQCAVEVLEDDTEEVLLERIKAAERAQLVRTVGSMMRDGWRVEGRRAFLNARP